MEPSSAWAALGMGSGNAGCATARPAARRDAGKQRCWQGLPGWAQGWRLLATGSRVTHGDVPLNAGTECRNL